MSKTLERWGSKRAFILAVTGAAVGLGNIWRFPYVAGENGGAAFLLIYVAFVILLGIPVMMAEILIGRAGRQGPMQALGALAAEASASRHWRWLGLFGAFTVFCILSFYSVVSGWSIEFLVASINGNFKGASAADIGAGFDAFLANPGLLVFNHTLFLLMTMAVVAAGVANGLERLNNLLMPLLYGLLLLVLDISVALLAGIAIFSVVFSQGMDPADGPGLMFVTLPIAFSELPLGSLWLSVFFLLLLLATWTSAINLAEPMVATLQGFGWRRSVSTAVVALSVWSIGLLSALSFSTLDDFRPLFGRNVFELVSSIPPDIFLPLGGLLIAIFAAWVLPRGTGAAALGAGERGYLCWRNVVRWVSIPLTLMVLLSGLL
ncbi:MAG: sodium-dependent transporter [Halomonas sp.]|nr:sodium-dependent transporter [Halomonas sp.]